MPKPEISLKHPHDSFFKKIFDNEENIRDFLKAYLPKQRYKRIKTNIKRDSNFRWWESNKTLWIYSSYKRYRKRRVSRDTNRDKRRR